MTTEPNRETAMKPDFVTQNAEHMSPEDRRKWADAVADEQKEKGANFWWFATHETLPDLVMVMGWKSEPDWSALPEPEWALVAA